MTVKSLCLSSFKLSVCKGMARIGYRAHYNTVCLVSHVFANKFMSFGFGFICVETRFLGYNTVWLVSYVFKQSFWDSVLVSYVLKQNFWVTENMLPPYLYLSFRGVDLLLRFNKQFLLLFSTIFLVLFLHHADLGTKVNKLYVIVGNCN